jgi:hypothetical protein
MTASMMPTPSQPGNFMRIGRRDFAQEGRDDEVIVE